MTTESATAEGVADVLQALHHHVEAFRSLASLIVATTNAVQSLPPDARQRVANASDGGNPSLLDALGNATREASALADLLGEARRVLLPPDPSTLN